MSEEAVRIAVAERSGGLCEAKSGRADEMSHRESAGRGGLWTVHNILHLSRYVHALCHQWPARAYELGWFVRSHVDPQTVPVWLIRPWPGWWRIADADDGGPHLLYPLQVEDLERDYREHFADITTGEIRIPAPPKWVPAQRTPPGAQPEGIKTHAHQH